MTTAIVVGSGPNGLAAAARLARAGVDVTVLEASDTIGGGVRSGEMIVPGLLHDHCSAVHPIAAGSPLLRELALTDPGITWCQPEVDCAHPLDDGTAGVYYRSVAETERALGEDGRRWRRMFQPMAEHFDDLFADASQPILRVPRHPVRLARFGALAALPATTLTRAWRTDGAKALWAGHRRPRLPPSRSPDDQCGRADAVRGRPRRGLGRGQGRVADDRRCAGRRHPPPRRADRDRRAGHRSGRSPVERPADARRVAVGRGRHPRRPAAGSGCPCVPPVPSRSGCIQGRLRRRGRGAVDGARSPAGGHGASRWELPTK